MRIDIFGLSLAETALVLLFGVFAALLVGEGEQNRTLEQSQLQQDQFTALRQRLKSEEASNAALRGRMDALLPKLRSTAFPSCVAVGKATGWLFTATVHDRDAYEIGGQELTLHNIIATYSAQLHEADEGECRQRIKLYVGKGVSGEEYEYAMRRIGQYFYLGYMGSQ